MSQALKPESPVVTRVSRREMAQILPYQVLQGQTMKTRYRFLHGFALKCPFLLSFRLAQHYEFLHTRYP